MTRFVTSQRPTGILAGIARHAFKYAPIEVVERVNVSVAHGIEGDYRGTLKPGSTGRRQVTLIERNDWLAATAEVGVTIPWQERRANLMVDGLDLPQTPGTRLRIGDVLLEVTRRCDPCHRMDELAPGLKAAMRPDWRCGVCARVLAGGEIEIGATIGIEESMTKPFNTLDDMGELHGKRVLVREDLNVPMADGQVTDATRLRAALGTVTELADRGAIVLVLAHFGRPKGARHPDLSLALLTRPFSDVLGRPVRFIDDCAGAEAEAAVATLQPGDIALLENTRFHAGEEANDPALAAAMARLGDAYVNDAFSAAHRAHASTEGLAHLLPAYAGRAMEAELVALAAALDNPAHPVAAVVGGAKVSTKLDVLGHLVGKVDHLIIGGGMANTFLAARGVAVGKSLCEHELAATVEAILARAEIAGCTVHLPFDVVVAREFRANPPTRVANVHEVAADEMILDIGPAAAESLGDVLKTCRTLVWNGPLGAFETPPFDTATVALARTAAALTQSGDLVSVAGGGDTVAALNQAGVADLFTYVSTAGGAFLEWMEGRELPGVAALKQR